MCWFSRDWVSLLCRSLFFGWDCNDFPSFPSLQCFWCSEGELWNLHFSLRNIISWWWWNLEEFGCQKFVLRIQGKEEEEGMAMTVGLLVPSWALPSSSPSSFRHGGHSNNKLQQQLLLQRKETVCGNAGARCRKYKSQQFCGIVGSHNASVQVSSFHRSVYVSMSLFVCLPSAQFLSPLFLARHLWFVGTRKLWWVWVWRFASLIWLHNGADCRD